MRSIRASMRMHPSYVPYEIPEPISHVHLLAASVSPTREDEARADEPEIANVVDLSAARARLRPAG